MIHSLDYLVGFIEGKITEFNKTEKIQFSEIFKVHERENHNKKIILSSLLPEKRGVYILFKENSPVYVGSTGKNKRTIQKRIADFLYYNPEPMSEKFSDRTRHSLTNKLFVENKKTKKFELKDFYKSLSKNWQIKVLETEDEISAKVLEYALIMLLRTKYNSEIN
ncbi:MAG: hypothetical protein KAR51_03940 [Candidatus Aenigmarchaeota archaeon]|nr:hypothetical protein [Candidatus Aenigmarchaeota archaeon]